jgi:hypothetical protein
MRRSTIILWAACLGLGLVPRGVSGQSTPDQPVRDDVAMQKWVEFMTPGQEHELLRQRVGKWTVKLQMWTAPDSSPLVSEGEAQIESVLGGRYVVQQMNGTLQDREFKGRSTTGYDKLKDKFVSVWIDNFGTGFLVSTGTYDQSTRTFNYSTMTPDVEQGDYKRIRTAERIVGQDKWVVEMYDTTDDGEEYLMMKAVYQRAES